MDFSIQLDISSCDLASMLPQCSHITRKRGVYYYRRRLPGDTRAEVALSLRTRHFREAQWLAIGLDQEFRRIIASVSNDKKKATADIQRIARDYLKRRLEWDMELRVDSPHIGVYSRSTEPGRIVADDLEWIEGELLGAQARLRDRLYDHERDTIDGVMQRHAVPEEQRNALAHAIYQADVEFWETVLERTKGNFSEPVSLRQTEVTQSNGVAVEAAPTSPLLSEKLPGFLEFMSKHESWSGQTLAQNKATYTMFKECCGDLPVTAYERKHCAEFHDLLLGLPKLYSKSAAWRDLPLAEIVAQTKDGDHERLSVTTVKRHFAALGRFFAYLKRRGEYLGENPAHGFEFPDKRRARSKRSMWQGEALSKLFSSPVWTGCLSEARRSRPGELIIKDDKYWLPLLGIFHGNRLEEFAQLERADVRNEDDIWFLDINDEGDKQVKNEQSKRRVPLHPELLRLGFLDYVEKTAPSPNDRVFPLLRAGGPDQKLGYYFTKWWTRYRKDIGVYQKGLDYHSFRANVTTRLAEADVSLEVRNELLGREGKSTDERHYQKGFTLKFLADAIGRISWPEVQL